MTVLIVDDEKLIQQIHAKIVKELGHEVLDFANNGKEGLEKYKSLYPDLVLSDIEMPEMDGIEMTNKLLETDYMAKVILISTLQEYGMFNYAVGAGAVEFVNKPLNKPDLQAAIERLMKE